MSELLEEVFADCNISVTGHEVKQAEELLQVCKRNSLDAHDAAVNILGNLELPIQGNLMEFKTALVEHRIFKN